MKGKTMIDDFNPDIDELEEKLASATKTLNDAFENWWTSYKHKDHAGLRWSKYWARDGWEAAITAGLVEEAGLEIARAEMRESTAKICDLRGQHELAELIRRLAVCGMPKKQQGE
jgi:hypothetical protein